MDLRLELAQLVDESRENGLTFVDNAALDRLMHRHQERTCECRRVDLLAGDQFGVRP